jgi:hypothetical protein
LGFAKGTVSDCSAQEAQRNQHDHAAYGSIDDARNQSSAKRKTNLRQKPACDRGADDPDNNPAPLTRVPESQPAIAPTMSKMINDCKSIHLSNSVGWSQEQLHGCHGRRTGITAVGT